MIRTCPVDGKPVIGSGRGRPPTYCSGRCKRMVARYVAGLPRMRLQLEWWRAMAAKHPRDPIYRFEANASSAAATIARFELLTRKEATDDDR